MGVVPSAFFPKGDLARARPPRSHTGNSEWEEDARPRTRIRMCACNGKFDVVVCVYKYAREKKRAAYCEGVVV